MNGVDPGGHDWFTDLFSYQEEEREYHSTVASSISSGTSSSQSASLNLWGASLGRQKADIDWRRAEAEDGLLWGLNALFLGMAIESAGVEFARAAGQLASSQMSANPALDNATSVWNMPPMKRGVAIEKAAGVNIGGNYPVIDDLRGGVATSVKSIDLNAATYQKAGTVESKVKGYVDKLNYFQGVRQQGFDSRGTNMSTKVLNVYIPMGSGSTSQRQQMSNACTYGASCGITVNYYGVQ